MLFSDTYANAFIVQSGLLSEAAVDTLTQDSKIGTISDIASALMRSISDSLSSVDFTKIDKSRGDIRQLEFLSDIQKSIDKLRELYKTTDGDASYRSNKLLDIIVETIKNLNKYSDDYKDSYRLKKSIMMIQYETVVSSLIQALSYLISTTVDLTDGSNYCFVQGSDPKKVTYFDVMSKFNDMVNANELKKVTESTDFLRKYYCEFPPETMMCIYEAPDVVAMLNSGLNNFINKMKTNYSFQSLIYKSAIGLSMLYSARDALYALDLSKYKLPDATNNIKQFSDIENIKPTNLNLMRSFSKKNETDAETATDLTAKKVEEDNRKVAEEIKKDIPVRLGMESPADKPVAPAVVKTEPVASDKVEPVKPVEKTVEKKEEPETVLATLGF